MQIKQHRHIIIQQKDVGSNSILMWIVGLRKLWIQKCLWPKKCLGPKTYWVIKFLVKKCLVKKDSGSKEIMAPKIFWFQRKLRSTKILT